MHIHLHRTGETRAPRRCFGSYRHLLATYWWLVGKMLNRPEIRAYVKHQEGEVQHQRALNLRQRLLNQEKRHESVWLLPELAQM